MINRTQINIDDMSETELKALLYEQFCELENTQKNIAVIKARLQLLLEHKAQPLNTNQIKITPNNVVPFTRS